MAVDKALLENCILEAAGDDAELATALRTKLSANDAQAAKFVAGFMRNSDYTKKTQDLATERKTFDSQSAQLETARKALEAAETEKQTILNDLAKHRVSTAKARELMMILRDKYSLDDNDLPGMSDLIETAKKGKPVDNTDDIETRLSKFGEDLMSKMEKKFVDAMMPELGSMAALPMIWGEISREHEELTGKRLTYTEQQDILKAARADNKPLRAVWEEKYNIAGDAGLRMQKRDENLKKGWETEREAADADKRSKAALDVVTPHQADLGTGPGISAAFKTKFREYPMDPNQQPGAPGSTPGKDGVPSLTVMPGQHVRQAGDRGPSGAQRAAAKYIEKMSKTA